MGHLFLPWSDQTSLQFWGFVADLRACYVSFKADLKARHQMHNLQRWYKCNLFLGFSLLGVSGNNSHQKKKQSSVEFYKDLVFTSSAHPPRFCDRCLALQGDRCPTPMDYRNVGPTAAWGMTNISHETYQVLDRRWMSPWETISGFHFLTMISHDWLHHVYLGTARDFCASGGLTT